MIVVNLGIDRATYPDERAINLLAYAIAVAKIVKPKFPELKMRFVAFEDDNAETTYAFGNTDYKTCDDIRDAVQNAEGETYSDESVWSK